MTTQSNGLSAGNAEAVQETMFGGSDQSTALHSFGSPEVAAFLEALTAAGHPVWSRQAGGFPDKGEISRLDSADNAVTIADHRDAPGAHLATHMDEGAFVVLDVDIQRGPDGAPVPDAAAQADDDADRLRADLEAHGITVHAAVASGAGGWHLYVTRPARPFKSSTRKLRDHPRVDVKPTGHVFLPGSRRDKHDGAPYRLAFQDLAAGAGDAEAAEALADWLDDQLPAPAAPMSAAAPPIVTPAGRTRLERWAWAALKGEAERLAATTAGGRNAALNNAALKLGHYAHLGAYGEEEAREALLAACRENGVLDEDGPRTCAASFASGWRDGTAEPLTPALRDDAGPLDLTGLPNARERRRPAASARRDDQDGEESGPAAAGDPDKETTGQARIAYRLAAARAGRLMHTHGLGWHYWTGTHWAEDQGATRATQAVLAVLRTSWGEALVDKQLEKDVKACHTATGLRGVLDIAATLPEFAVTTEDLDADPYLLNVANGTLDLRTLELKPHDPADRCTKITRGAYRPDEGAPTFPAFLASSLPDPEVRGYLQRYVGQALVGRTLEQKLVILTGEGGNGKSVLSGALEFALGEYALTPQADMLLARKDSTTFTGAVELRGRRWVVFSEVDKGRELAAATIKRLTGGDRITARQLYKANVTFDPSHSLAMLANDLPEVPDTTHGMWRRLSVVPFNVTFQEGDPRRDDALPEKLKAEADAVLSWAVAGWEEYQRRGLDAPAAVQVATASYREETDEVARFLAAVTTRLPGVSVGTSALHAAYQEWARVAREKGGQLGRKQFGKELERHGLKQDSRRQWKGVAIRQGWDEEEEIA